MALKACLLVTDDADDHQAFSEALSEISSSTVALIILDSEKAIEMMRTKKFVPDYLFVDLSMNGIRINTFLKQLKEDVTGLKAPIVVYGEKMDFKKIESPMGVTFFDKDYEYSSLKHFLTEIIQTPG